MPCALQTEPMNKSAKKLQLKRETLRRLSNPQLARVHGGMVHGGYCSIPDPPYNGNSCSTTADTECDGCTVSSACGGVPI